MAELHEAGLLSFHSSTRRLKDKQYGCDDFQSRRRSVVKRLGIILHTYRKHGGVATWLDSLVPELSKSYEIRLGIINRGDDTSHLNIKETFFGASEVRKVLWRSEVAVIWHLVKEANSIFKNIPKIPIVAVSHEGSQGKSTFLSMLHQGRYSDKIVCVEESAIDSVPETMHYKTMCIPNSRNPETMKVGVGKWKYRESLNISKEQVLLGSMSRISLEKDLHIIAKARQMLGARFVHVVGGRCPIELYPYRSMLRDYGSIVAEPMNTIDLLNASDYFVNTSPSEGNSYSLLEALTWGIPAISTKVGLLNTQPHLARILEDNKAKTLADAIRDEEANTENKVLRTINSKKWIEQRNSFSEFVAKWEGLINDLTG